MIKFDFSGYATKNDLKCTDGRTIRKDAFKADDGKTVPLVWQHFHNEPANVLGHAVLENREDGVYAYGIFNDTKSGQDAKLIVQHHDVAALSIYANELVQQNKNVMHGVIRELSLVLAGSNAGALIDNVNFSHGDGSVDVSEEDAIIYSELGTIVLPTAEPEVILVVEPELQHADASVKEKTVNEIFDSLTEEQKQVLYSLVGAAIDANTSDDTQTADNTATHSSEGEENVMKTNVFDKKEESQNTLSHAQILTIVSDGVKCGSLKESFLKHTVEYGIENIDYMFPDARTVTNTPSMVQRRMEWVSVVLSGTNHTPFSRIKSLTADITADTARAMGYIKGNLKKDEIIRLLHRTTTAATIYKKQKLDRDDIIDITDFDVVAWLKTEMRTMLDEELARAVLIGDGRASDSEEKIAEDHIRPIWTDDDLYAYHVRLGSTDTAEETIEAVIRARQYYGGSGSPTMFTTTDFLTDMLLLKDLTGRRLYNTQGELETVLRVSKIVEVPVMNTMTRESTDSPAVDLNLQAIVLNLKDYTIGADKGGAVAMFDDFDIDFNQQKYLIETRCSGALTVPYSALVFEKVDDEA